MKVTDRFTVRDKGVEKMVRQLGVEVAILTNCSAPNKDNMVELSSLTLELFLKVFKQLENNITTPKTLLDYTEREIKDACLRAGPSARFQEDHQFVQDVMKRLTK